MQLKLLEVSTVTQWPYWLQLMALASLFFVFAANIFLDKKFSRKALLIVSSFVIYYAIWSCLLAHEIAAGVFFGVLGLVGIIISRTKNISPKLLQHGFTVLLLFLIAVIFYFEVFRGHFFCNTIYINLSIAHVLFKLYFKSFTLWGMFSIASIIYAYVHFKKSEKPFLSKNIKVSGTIISCFWITVFSVQTLGDWNFKMSGHSTNRTFRAITKDIIYGFDVNATDSDGYTRLHKAVKNEDFEEVKRLVEAGADVNIRNRSLVGGSTPIVSAINKNYDIFVYLMEHGAKFNKPVNILDRSLISSVDKQNKDDRFIKHLLVHGADISFRDHYGNQLIHEVAELNFDPNGAFLRYLAENGADINSIGQTGTPLNNAASSGNLNAIKTLIALGADPTIKSKTNKSLLETAIWTKKICSNHTSDRAKKKREQLDMVIEYLENLPDNGTIDRQQIQQKF